MRAAAFLVLMLLAGLSITVGSFHLAVLLAAVKAIIVGLVYMDLRHAHRGHAVGFALGVAVLIAALAAVGS